MNVEELHAVKWHKTETGDHTTLCDYHPNDWHNRRFGRRLRFVRYLVERGVFSERKCPCSIEPCECIDLETFPY